MEPLQSCYQGQKDDSPLKWQTEDFMVWFHNPWTVSSAGNLWRELLTSSPDLQDVGRDFGFSLCAVPLSDSCPKILEQGDRRLEDQSKYQSCSWSRT